MSGGRRSQQGGGECSIGLVEVMRGVDLNCRTPPVKAPIPLVSVSVNASLVHAVAQVEVTQVYVNREERPIEAVYYFPVNPDGAVTGFQAEVEGRIIKGEVKKEDQAREVYLRAVRNKRTACLGEETKPE